MSRIPKETLDRAVTGVGLVPGTLRDQIGEEITLLVFLRHFGCMFCRETVGDLRDAVRDRSDFPSVLFFFQGSSTEGRAFLRRDWPDARAVSDPDLEFYELFDIRQASFLEALGPSVLAARGRARKKGHENGPRSGDIWRMPGVFAVGGDEILWSHDPAHAADHPVFSEIPELIANASRS
ncbi:MAG: SelL-related redox protein [Myxococcota bacterium]